MPIWMGNPGRQAELPSPRRGLTPTLERPSTAKQTIGGGQTVARGPGPGRRTYSPTWSYLDQASFSTLEEMFTGAYGGGPYALVDPARRNMLSANQSSTTAVNSTAAGFTVDPAEDVSSSDDLLYDTAPRSLLWQLPAAPAGGILRLDPPAGLPGIPAPPGRPWTFAGRLAGGGTTGTAVITPALLWMDATGQPVGTTVGTPITLMPGVFAPFSVTASAPAGACFQPQLIADPASIAATLPGPGDVPVRRAPWTMPPKRAANVGPLPRPINLFRPAGSYDASVYASRLQLDMFDAVRPWVLGTGVPMVSITALPEAYTAVLPDRACTATFVEVG